MAKRKQEQMNDQTANRLLDAEDLVESERAARDAREVPETRPNYRDLEDTQPAKE